MELEPFLRARSPDVREKAPNLLEHSEDPGAEGSRLLLYMASTGKNSDVLFDILKLMGSYPSLREYLEGQCFKKTRIR